MILSSFTRIFHFETSQLECRVNMLSDARENMEFSAKVLNASTYPLSVEDDLPIDEFLFVQRSFNPFEIAACLILTLLHFSKIVLARADCHSQNPI